MKELWPFDVASEGRRHFYLIHTQLHNTAVTPFHQPTPAEKRDIGQYTPAPIPLGYQRSNLAEYPENSHCPAKIENPSVNLMGS
jgi:hypothetical protein